MKCPKCNYVSFDYNSDCPKCGKDISAEQGRLNLPAFKPDPPSLLGILIGHPTESSPALSPSTSRQSDFASEAGQGFDEPLKADAGELSLDGSSDLDLSLESSEAKPAKDSGQFDLSTEEKSLSEIDLDELPSDELPLESESLSLEQGSAKVEPAPVASQAAGSQAASAESDEIDLGLLETEVGGAPKDTGEIELKLDDLKINHAGGLEVGEKASSTEESDKPIEIDEITLDEIPIVDELNLDDSTLNEGKPAKTKGDGGGETDALDLDNLDLDLEMEEEQKPA